jgi:mRNA interferase MazF
VKEGYVVLTPLLESDGKIRNRPAIILRKMPPYQDFLVCRVSTKLHQFVPNFDELIRSGDDDFVDSGLNADSVIRLGFLAVLPRNRILGSIGSISPQRHKRLLESLSTYLVENVK